MPEFNSRDPDRPGFWDERFAAGFTPWDEARTPPALMRFVERERGALGPRVLVPGCGSGHEVAALDAAGFEVLAIDFAPRAIAQAARVLPPEVARRCLRQADFFRFEEELREASALPPFDWVYERAFLPALSPARWPQWAARLAAIMRPGGLLAGLFFVDQVLPARRSGPPFVTARAELDSLLSANFTCTDAQPLPSDETLPVFAGRLQWMVWQRR